MATPVSNSVPLTNDPIVNGLVQGSSWQFGGGPHTLTYSLSLNDNLGISGPIPWSTRPDIAAAVAQALTAWSNVANVSFTQAGSGSVYPQSSADIAITLTGSDLSQLGAVGLTLFPDPVFANSLLGEFGYDRSSYPRPEGDVFLDNYSQPLGSVNPGSIGYEVILHELGHALGLKHTFDDGGNERPTYLQLFGSSIYDGPQYTVMGLSNATVGQVIAATPMLYDIAAIQSIYGTNMAFHTGNDTYNLQPYTNAIWDAGGIDTLDASNVQFFAGAVIDLRAGEFSYSNGTPSVVNAIAFGVTIENASGSNGDDTIYGNDADNRIDGGAGADTMSGGNGNDAYVLDNIFDVVLENPGAGTDLVQSSITFVLPTDVENLTLTGAANINGTGNNADNVIIGNSGNNTLTGGGGNDTMAGGNGDDIYIVDSTGDSIVENLGAGTDLVQSSATFTLSPNVENLMLTGTANINGTGNSSNNTITGNSGNNLLTAGAGNAVLDGGGGFDTLVGGTGTNTFVINSYASTHGGPTSIQIFGQPGNPHGGTDIRVVNPTDGSLQVNYADLLVTNGQVSQIGIYFQGQSSQWNNLIFDAHDSGQPLLPGTYENAVSWAGPLTGQPRMLISGDDIGQFTPLFGNFTVVALTIDYSDPQHPLISSLSVNFEAHDGSLTGPGLMGTVNINYAPAPLVLFPQVIGQSAGLNTVQTSLDAYVLPANVENLTLTGSGDLSGTGNNLNNTFISNSGINTLAGGLGNDIYFLNNAGDVVTENLNEGIDTVVAEFSYTLVGTNLENVTLTGSAGLTATGNAFNNVLTSNAGVDTLTGGLGNDTYVLSNAADSVVENAGEGTDTVQLAADFNGTSYALPTTIENATNLGPASLTLTGNAFDNILVGGTGVDLLIGALGNDTLNGGFARDTARFSGPMSSYTITHTGTSGTVTGPDGSDTFSSIERLEFDDQSLSFVVPKNSFNGDLSSDVIWRNDNGSVAIWSMQDATHHAADFVQVLPTNWHINGTDDFNGDGKSDVLWRGDDGGIAVWTMQDATHHTADFVQVLPTDWHISGTGDFNGDGKSDVLWRGDDGGIAVWTMQDATHHTADFVQVLPTDWHVSSTGDFNGDGKSDVLWRGDNGGIAIWTMQDATHHTADFVQVLPTDWHVSGTGDFNGDGKSDVLWRNDNGSVAIWSMQDATHHTADLVQVLPTDWHIAGTPDVNGDAKSDVLWRNDNGSVAVWTMQDATHHTAELTQALPADWTVA